MNPTIRLAKLLGFCCVLTMAAAAPTSKPAAGPDTSIAKDQYHFPAPPVDEWTAVKPDPDGDNITYLNQKHDGAIQMILLAKDASVDSDIAMNVAIAIVKQLKAQHAQNKDVMVMEPKIEKDKRFAFIVHEKYKAGDKTADQIHVYRAVGPRVLMLTVNSVADDPDKAAAIHAAGKDMLAGAKFNRKAFKKDN
jgi:hypothetical protein